MSSYVEAVAVLEAEPERLDAIVDDGDAGHNRSMQVFFSGLGCCALLVA